MHNWRKRDIICRCRDLCHDFGSTDVSESKTVNKSCVAIIVSWNRLISFFIQDVRSSADRDFSFNITYREFTAEMIQELISHSLYCSQKIKYDCYKAPLELHSATWFLSSMESDIVDYLGNVKRGTCLCAGTQLHPAKCRVWCERLFWILCFAFHFSYCCWFLLIADKITFLYNVFTVLWAIFILVTNLINTRNVLVSTDIFLCVLLHIHLIWNAVY